MGHFDEVTRVAISEILMSYMQETRFGFVITPESFEELTDELKGFFMTSRNLKNAGDRLLTQGPQAFLSQQNGKRRSF